MTVFKKEEVGHCTALPVVSESWPTRSQSVFIRLPQTLSSVTVMPSASRKYNRIETNKSNVNKTQKKIWKSDEDVFLKQILDSDWKSYVQNHGNMSLQNGTLFFFLLESMKYVH